MDTRDQSDGRELLPSAGRSKVTSVSRAVLYVKWAVVVAGMMFVRVCLLILGICFDQKGTFRPERTCVAATVMFVGFCFAEEVTRYRLGYTCGGDFLLTGLFLFLGGLCLFALVHVLACMAALRSRRAGLICLGVVYAATVVFVVSKHTPNLFLVGFRDGVLAKVSLDELRQIRQVVLSTRQQGETVAFHRVTPRWNERPASASPELKCEEPEFEERWQTLCEQTKIKKLAGRLGIEIQSDRDVVTLFWGVGFGSHLGLIIGQGVAESSDPEEIRIYVAEDVIAFLGQ